MNIFYFGCLVFYTGLAFGQQDYFNPEVKKKGVEHYKELMYRGCSEVNEKVDSVPAKEMKKLVLESIEIVEENFSRAFTENPKVHAAFKKDLNDLATDPRCQQIANDCRVTLMGLSLYYYQQFRPDIPECQNYIKLAPTSKGYNASCEVELKFRKSSLNNVHNTGYGTPGPGLYKNELVTIKNNTSMRLFNTLLQKDKVSLHICRPAQIGNIDQYGLALNSPGDYMVGMDPDFLSHKKAEISSQNKPVLGCVEEKILLSSEFVPVGLEKGKSSIGLDEVEPIKKKINDFVIANPNLIITDMMITSTSSKTPFHTTVAGKKVIDPKSDEKNLALAKERLVFAEKMLAQIKQSHSKLDKVALISKAELAGPDFSPIDLNDRWVTKMTPGYMERIESMYKKNQQLYEEQAFISSPQELLNEKEYVNLYQAKFKPFQGFRIQIKGHRKEEMKCNDYSGSGQSNKPTSSSKQ